MDFSDEDRIRFVQPPRWIGYSRAKEILASLGDMLSSPVLDRMPNLLVIGETNNGKTMLARRFARLHPREEREDQSLIPVLYGQAPSAPEAGRLYNHILAVISAPYQARDTAAGKEIQVVRLLRFGLATAVAAGARGGKDDVMRWRQVYNRKRCSRAGLRVWARALSDISIIVNSSEGTKA